MAADAENLWNAGRLFSHPKRVRALAVVSLACFLRIGHLPDFKAYFDYDLAFSTGFNASPKPPGEDAHWLVFFFFSNLPILLRALPRPFSTPSTLHRSGDPVISMRSCWHNDTTCQDL